MFRVQKCVNSKPFDHIRRNVAVATPEEAVEEAAWSEGQVEQILEWRMDHGASLSARDGDCPVDLYSSSSCEKRLRALVVEAARRDWRAFAAAIAGEELQHRKRARVIFDMFWTHVLDDTVGVFRSAVLLDQCQRQEGGGYSSCASGNHDRAFSGAVGKLSQRCVWQRPVTSSWRENDDFEALFLPSETASADGATRSKLASVVQAHSRRLSSIPPGELFIPTPAASTAAVTAAAGRLCDLSAQQPQQGHARP